ncbi:bifunctional 3,4-dihydroxy-2-butanone-4-phosphate synthase/GTP cyclohydrolase II, partial [Pseudanabaenaceae cyanobacterium LEGE 13415]|nr:bifunctional 3,4-dihydroxy-2-butanone-4-phosphate synthase/GTP cyclohydrolase II [Pseudanabaenaceae cyanobacterium LEGE 13415]
GLEMVDRVPLLTEATTYNLNYLTTKAEKLGHLFLRTYLTTIALHLRDDLNSVTERYALLEKLRQVAKSHDLMLQEENRPMALALFDRSSLIIHLGFEQEIVNDADWYKSPKHSFTRSIAKILDDIALGLSLEKLEFIVSPGTDPLVGLQVQLDRQTFPLGHPLPSKVCESLSTQTIYSFVKL